MGNVDRVLRIIACLLLVAILVVQLLILQSVKRQFVRAELSEPVQVQVVPSEESGG